MLICTFFLVVSFVTISCSDGSQKRILLSDPQYIQQELTRFQSELQELQVKYRTQSTQLTDLQTKYSIQSTQLTDLQAKDSTQSTQLTDLQAKVSTKSTQLSDLQANYNTQSTQLSDLQTAIHHGNKGAVFTRWGRGDCPANVTTLVYSGYAGGSQYTHTGAAAEYVCMPKDPLWGPHKDLVGPYSIATGYVYGSEYERPAAMFGMSNLQEDVPCAVCFGNKHNAMIMIPGRTQCYPGWTEAYHGDLASGYYNHVAATQYVCVDHQPEALPGGGNRDEDGKLFYGVRSKCGPLPCPPYEDEKYLACVVCMK